MVIATEKQQKWWTQYTNVGTLIFSVLVSLAGAFITIYSVAVTQEQRWAENTKFLTILKERQDGVLKHDIEQDDRVQRIGAEQHIYLERIIVQLETANQRLIALERGLYPHLAPKGKG